MFVGHQKIIKLLKRQIASGKTSQAYLFCGPEKVGKKTLALQIASELSGEGPQKINGDVSLISPEVEEKRGVKKALDIRIDKIRELRREISLHSVGGQHRIFIIDKAEKLTHAAQNALLKILEEPNEKAIIFLISGDESRILPTISSRCQRIKFSLVSEKEISKLIPENVPNKEAIIFWSLSRPGIAQDLLDNESEMEIRKEAFFDFKTLFGGSLAEKFSLAEKMSRDKEATIHKINLWLVLLRSSLLRINARIRISPKKAFGLIEKIDDSLKTITKTNANLRVVLENIFLEF